LSEEYGRKQELGLTSHLMPTMEGPPLHQ